MIDMDKKLSVSLQCLQTGILLNYFLVYFDGIIYTPQLTDDEKEYLEAVRECKEEGRIIERDRRMLERLRRSLGLSEERAGELESIV